MRYSVRDMETLPQPRADGNRIAGNGGRIAGNGGSAAAARTTAVGVLDRSVALLDLLGDGPRSLRYLAEASGLPRPTAHRLLVALDSHGLVARDAGGTFRLGPRLTELAAGPAGGWNSARWPGRSSAGCTIRPAKAFSCMSAPETGGCASPPATPARACATAFRSARCCHSTPVPAARCCWPGRTTASRFPAVPAAELAAIRRRGWAASVAEREAGRGERQRAGAAGRPAARRGLRLRARQPAGPGRLPPPGPGGRRRRRRAGRRRQLVAGFRRRGQHPAAPPRPHSTRPHSTRLRGRPAEG